MENKKFQAGFGRIDVTSNAALPLGGYGNPDVRKARAVRNKLFLSCYAITDQNGETALIMNLDTCVTVEYLVKRAIKDIGEKYGIPANRIFLTSTHTHSAPDPRSVENSDLVYYIDNIVEPNLVVCAGLALDDLAPAKIFIGDIEAEGLNFVRHYRADPQNGEAFYFGDNFNNHLETSEIVQKYTTHATKADPTLHLLKFEREGTKDLIIANWRAHATLTGGINKYDLSSDFPGETRKIVEERTGCYFTYFQGAAGNINAKTRIDSERITEDCTAYSNIFADTVIKGLENLKPLESKPFKFIAKTVTVDVNHLQDNLADKAKEVWDFFKSSGSRAKANELGRKYGFNSIYHAAAVRRKKDEPQTRTIPINAFTIGELGFITAPNELFDTTSVHIEERAPYEKVITLGYCNGSMGYVPTEAAYEYGCYEADNSSYAPGTAEKLEEAFVDMLNKLKD